jgi:hypothetical protein
MHVGNVECKKDTRKVLEKTIGIPLNQSLHLTVGKTIVIHCADTIPTITLADEPPADCQTDTSFWMETRTFIAGDLSFYATILGKENMAGSWCTWCMLSKAQWCAAGHQLGEPWTIEKIYNIRRNVTQNSMPETPETIMGCTDKPLFDAVPVCNYILSILHIIIGIGNSLVGSVFEWIEERVEKMTAEEIEARNSVLFAEVQHDRAKEEYNHWLENDGITLVDKQLSKTFLKETFQEKVSNF